MTTDIAAALLADIDLDRLAELMRTQGYRVDLVREPGGDLLRSATGGLAFEIRGGSPAPECPASFIDLRCLAGLKIEGELDPAVINAWNVQRRYARLHRQEDLLVLTLDVSLAGGVMPAYVVTQIAIWDRLLQDLPVFLRETLAPRAAAAAAGPAKVAPAA
ncbi:MAG: YbjN domain-containing protein [Rhodoplanes sp.]|uniref:YbjN domain-containing protein n=1 Tax=Rhodoplanes sp. TaxID=1968906 RepID=UPI00183D9E7A|nr:YbjN domain-containing protein [Rhodoplanes sp.]NVO17711.1 YbjN domain-containing protein [Rhodoplanes sp.]